MHEIQRSRYVMRSAMAGMLLVGLAVGCDRGPKMAPVVGTVTVNGEPIKLGTIMFYPSSGRPATGQIGSDGTYSLTTLEPGDGAPPGEYVVTIDAVEVAESTPAPTSLEEEIAAGASGKAPESTITFLVPEKYADRTSTPLTATVKDEDNTIDFEISE